MATDSEKKISNSINAPSEDAHKAATAARKAPGPGAKLDPMVPPTPDPRWGVENCCVREFWAVLDRDGTLVRGRNVVRTTHLGTGIYEVFFTGDVSNGAFVSTIGRPGIATEPPCEITVALRCCPGMGAYTPFDDNKGVWIQTFDSSGKPSDRSTHTIVMTQ
ncbi:MAG: hypothetical protein QOF09_1415 [Alphaproteobacteria bacterium]|jgi:hypothetical protein|nr:hypothetical protein [Alphaproteobacteria bacterium]